MISNIPPYWVRDGVLSMVMMMMVMVVMMVMIIAHLRTH